MAIARQNIIWVHERAIVNTGVWLVEGLGILESLRLEYGYCLIRDNSLKYTCRLNNTMSMPVAPSSIVRSC